jgi:hypothetical protein
VRDDDGPGPLTHGSAAWATPIRCAPRPDLPDLSGGFPPFRGGVKTLHDEIPRASGAIETGES